ncbi:reverse transcriptase [Gossypium australe]|uniref:Reverse transcriptase n=1 Tax=Gossypium australe TaxID=47621 RepID=A0A5B6V8I0_9ROSI|nr:reverse transcriptase [Gossypium australe]
METKINRKRMKKVRRSYGFSNETDIEADEGRIDAEWRFTGFYGSLYDSNKNDSWNLLQKLGEDKTHPWLVYRDFNEILYSSEKSGGIAREERKMESFREVLEECRLEDIGYSGVWFTWERGNFAETNIRERLDRAKDRNDGIIGRIIDTKVRLNMEIDRDEIYWEQRARANRLKAGDKNLAFFHRYASNRKKINMISRLELEDGRETTEKSEIVESATSFFKNLFMSRGVGESFHLLQGIEKRISSDTNASLLSSFTEEDVVSALQEMRPTKAPGPDGFSAIFFQRYWHIVGKDVTSFWLGILNNGQDFGHLNSTDIVLIPKTQNPSNLSNFRPISLCSIHYKIVAKGIANRLQGVIEMCIDKSQSAFLPGRLISDNTLLAYEMLHTFRRKRMGNKGFMAVKLNMSKAYDKVEWGFIKEIMLKMGFDGNWVDLIMKCISSASYMVNVNGNREKLSKLLEV